MFDNVMGGKADYNKQLLYEELGSQSNYSVKITGIEISTSPSPDFSK